MRLGQFSRKYNQKSSEIVEILSKKFNLEIANHPNCKIPEEVIEELIFFLAPTDSKVSINQSVSSTAETIKENNQNNQLGQSNSSIEDLKSLNIENGVIRAPKIEVSGLKIVGKIELPTKKESDKVDEKNSEELAFIEDDKDENETKDVTGENLNDAKETKSLLSKTSEISNESNSKTTVSNTSKQKNILTKKKKGKLELTPDEKQKIRLSEIQRKQTELKKAKKDLRKKTFQANQKASEQNNKKKNKRNSKQISSDHKNEKKERPKSLWGKFVYWLND